MNCHIKLTDDEISYILYLFNTREQKAHLHPKEQVMLDTIKSKISEVTLREYMNIVGA